MRCFLTLPNPSSSQIFRVACLMPLLASAALAQKVAAPPDSEVAALTAPDLPDAPSSPDGQTPRQSSLTTAPDNNPLPIVNHRHYRPPTQGERLRTFLKDSLGPGAFIGSGIGSAINFQQNHPPEWGQDAAGYGQRFAASFGQNAIQSATLYVLSNAFHEDTRYLICHNCTMHDKLMNALLSDVTARHGADGHRSFSVTPIAAGFTGPIVSYSSWYPNDPDYTTARGARTAAIGFAVRPAAHFALELVDGHRIPLTHRIIHVNEPRPKEEVPVGWTGPLPPKG